MPVKTTPGPGPVTRAHREPLRLATPPAQRVVWVYAITDDLDPDQFAGLAGVGGERVRTVAEAGLTAVVGSVEAQAFGEDALASLLGGLDNIERVGRAHHQVIARAAAGGAPVLPLRLATVYPDDDTVRALLARRRGEFAGLLARFRDTVEWGVQIYGPSDQQDGADSLADTIDWVLADIADASQRQPDVRPALRARPGADDPQRRLPAARRSGRGVPGGRARAGRGRSRDPGRRERPLAAVLLRRPARRLIRAARGTIAGHPARLCETPALAGQERPGPAPRGPRRAAADRRRRADGIRRGHGCLT